MAEAGVKEGASVEDALVWQRWAEVRLELWDVTLRALAWCVAHACPHQLGVWQDGCFVGSNGVHDVLKEIIWDINAHLLHDELEAGKAHNLCLAHQPSHCLCIIMFCVPVQRLIILMN
jgi:hypothetical protein